MVRDNTSPLFLLVSGEKQLDMHCNQPPTNDHCKNPLLVAAYHTITMSQFPCLPVSRRRKRQNEGEPKFDDISQMDASQYLQMVVEQAQQLPDVFMADNHDEEKVDYSQFDDADEDENGTSKEKNDESLEKMDHSQSPSKKRHHDDAPTCTAQSTNRGSAAAFAYLSSTQTQLLPPPSVNHVPPTGRQWADRTLDAFSRLRQYLEQLDATERVVPLPPMKDRAGWHLFCVGKQEAEGNTGSYFDDYDDDEAKAMNNEDRMELTENQQFEDPPMEEDDVPAAKGECIVPKTTGITKPDWKDALESTPDGHYWPTTKLLMQMDQVMIRRVMSHLIHFICEGWNLTHGHSTWLYALAARLDRSVHRDEAVVIYNLLKKLTSLRAAMDDAEVLARINTLILIYGVYFEQGGGYSALMEPTSH